MSNTDFFAPLDAETLDLDIFASTDESVNSENEMFSDLAGLEGFDNLDNLEGFNDLFNTFALADQGDELGELGLDIGGSDRSPLLPPFLQEYESLKQDNEQLREALVQAERQLTAQERRSRSNDSLVEQQAAEISKNQEYLTQTVAEIQVYRDEAKRQQLQVETLAEQLAIGQNRIVELERDYVQLQKNTQVISSHPLTESLKEQLAISQNRIAELERNCVQLQENAQNSSQNVYRLERQLQELRTRLQRQQRYALQYKTALEQCLAHPNITPSSDIGSAITALTGKPISIQPWPGTHPEEDPLLTRATGGHPENLGLTLGETPTPSTLSSVSNSSPDNSLAAIPPVEHIFPWEAIAPEEVNLTTNYSPVSESVAEKPDNALAEAMIVEKAVEKVEKIEQPPVPVLAEPSPPSPQRSSHLSFSIQSQRAPRKVIDLPRFARQPVPQA